MKKLRELPDWPPHLEPRAGHAVAFPDVDLASLPKGHVLLGADAPADIVLDAAKLATPESVRHAVDRATAFWIGDGSRGHPLGAHELHAIDDLLAPTACLHKLVRSRIDEDAAALIPGPDQVAVLDHARGIRRAVVTGPAGSGKSILAAEKARRFAREGFRTLLVCFNQRLASELLHETAEAPAPHGLEVATFHRLCERLASEAGCLPPKPPDPQPSEWWDRDLPHALAQAIDSPAVPRFDAVVVDEGQDFQRDWLDTLDLLLDKPGESPFWVFHDPGQALFRPDVVADVPGLTPLELFENRRNPGPVAELAARFYHGGSDVTRHRTGGAQVDFVEAEPGPPAVDALRKVLHHLVEEEHVRPWEIASGTSTSRAVTSRLPSEVTFGSSPVWTVRAQEAQPTAAAPIRHSQALRETNTCVAWIMVGLPPRHRSSAAPSLDRRSRPGRPWFAGAACAALRSGRRSSARRPCA